MQRKYNCTNTTDKELNDFTKRLTGSIQNSTPIKQRLTKHKLMTAAILNMMDKTSTFILREMFEYKQKQNKNKIIFKN